MRAVQSDAARFHVRVRFVQPGMRQFAWTLIRAFCRSVRSRTPSTVLYRVSPSFCVRRPFLCDSRLRLALLGSPAFYVSTTVCRHYPTPIAARRRRLPSRYEPELLDLFKVVRARDQAMCNLEISFNAGSDAAHNQQSRFFNHVVCIHVCACACVCVCTFCYRLLLRLT